MNIQIKFIILGILTVFLIYLMLPGNQGTIAYADEEGKGSTIAGVNVEGLDHDEIVAAIQEAINKWTKDPIIVTGVDQELSLDAAIFEFNIDETIKEYETLVDKPWYAFWIGEKEVHISLHVNQNEEIKSQIAAVPVWDTEATYNQVLTQASYLKNHEIEATEKDFTSLENERLSLTIEEIPENTDGIDEVINTLNNTVINPRETFSFIETIGNKVTSANPEALNFIASMLYDGILQTEYELVERYPQEEIPTYLEAGREASINMLTNKDLKFINSSNHAALIKVTIEASTVKVEIYSDTKDKEVLVHIDKEYISPRIINRYSNNLAIGHEELVQEGTEGLRVVVERTISESGEVVEQQISRDYYAPVNRIVLKSSRQPETTVESDATVTETPEVDDTLPIDLNGDGLPDYDMEAQLSEDELPPGSYYDKGGNLITP